MLSHCVYFGTSDRYRKLPRLDVRFHYLVLSKLTWLSQHKPGKMAHSSLIDFFANIEDGEDCVVSVKFCGKLRETNWKLSCPPWPDLPYINRTSLREGKKQGEGEEDTASEKDVDMQQSEREEESKDSSVAETSKTKAVQGKHMQRYP